MPNNASDQLNVTINCYNRGIESFYVKKFQILKI